MKKKEMMSGKILIRMKIQFSLSTINVSIARLLTFLELDYLLGQAFGNGQAPPNNTSDAELDNLIGEAFGAEGQENIANLDLGLTPEDETKLDSVTI